MNPRHYHHGDLRAALVGAAETLLEERGPEGFTLRECARRVGVSNAAPAHHFADVAALLTEVAAQGFARLTAAMETARTTATDARAELRAIGEAYVATALGHPATFRLMFHSDRPDWSAPGLKAAGGAAYGLLNRVLAAALNVPEAPLSGVQLTWSVVHGFAALQIAGQFAADPRAGPAEAWSAALAPVLAGLERALD